MNQSRPGIGIGLEITGLEKAFGPHVAIAPMEFKVKAGEFLAMVGPSGCGKTTFLRMLSGLEVPDAGKIMADHQDITAWPTNQRNVALVFQLFTLYPHLRGLTNVTFPLRAMGMSSAEADSLGQSWMDRLGIGHLSKVVPAKMSLGERQLVAISRALVRNAALYLFDEPLSALDADHRRHAWLLIRDELKRRGATCIMVTHDQEEAMSLGDRVCVIRNGTIEQCDSPQALYEHPANMFVADFIGQPGMNLLPATRNGEWIRLNTLSMRLRVHEDRLAKISYRKVDTPCVVGIRPEWVAIVDRGAEVEIGHTAHVGPATLVHLHSPGQSLRAWLPAGIRLPRGSKSQIAFMATACHCFDAHTGERHAWRVLEVQCPAGN